MFAVLPAGARLAPHTDPFAGTLRYHLGLRTPNDPACWIRVDAERRHWRDGEAMFTPQSTVRSARNGRAGWPLWPACFHGVSYGPCTALQYVVWVDTTFIKSECLPSSK